MTNDGNAILREVSGSAASRTGMGSTTSTDGVNYMVNVLMGSSTGLSTDGGSSTGLSTDVVKYRFKYGWGQVQV